MTLVAVEEGAFKPEPRLQPGNGWQVMASRGKLWAGARTGESIDNTGGGEECLAMVRQQWAVMSKWWAVVARWPGGSTDDIFGGGKVSV